MLMIESKIVTHSNRKQELNHREDLFIQGFELYRVEVDRLTEQAWKADISGMVNKAYRYYKSIATYQLMHRYVELMWEDEQRLSPFDKPFISSYIIEKYKISCIDLNLPCIGRKACTDYTAVWEELLRIYNISLETTEVDECCIGLGKLIIEDQDDCKAFILDDCDDVKADISKPPSPGEFNKAEFSNDFTTEFPE